MTDVDSSIDGGTSVAVTSPFSITNKTTHKILLAVHPDPTHQPLHALDTQSDDKSDQDGKQPNINSEEERASSEHKVETISPDETHHFPVLLLEASLHLDGSHLGSLWLQADQGAEDRRDLLASLLQNDSELISHVGFSSRAVHFANLVRESAEIFKKANGDSHSAAAIGSGIQMSCPIVHHNGEVSAAPFCYVVEIRRSPLVKPFPGHGNQIAHDGSTDHLDLHASNEGADLVQEKDSTKEQKHGSIGNSKGGAEENKYIAKIQSINKVHGPVAYSLVIHPPIIIENLLPESGRFELMHATRRVVVWWADLKAGECAPVHTVGLDAPLLLLMNLGFCRTPVGEGALVHHGSSDKGKEEISLHHLSLKYLSCSLPF